MNKRVKYLDELRVFAIICIILLHVIGIFCYKYLDINKVSFLFMTLLSSLTRVGIPIFFMLTGILMLNKKEEENYFVFFKKRVMKLLIPFLFFSSIYYVYHVITKTTTLSVFEFVRQITSSTTEYHLWFMPVIITIYLFIPFIKHLVENLSKKDLKLLIALIFILSNGLLFIQSITTVFGYSLMSNFLLPNLIGYTNYLLVGYYLYKYNYKVSLKLIILSIISILCIPIFTLFVSNNSFNDVFLNSLSIFVFIPSILVFLLFKNKKATLPEKISNFVTNNSNSVIYVYYIHALILNILNDFIVKPLTTTGLLRDLGIILLEFLIVTISSFIFAYLWTKGKNLIKNNKEKIQNICIKLFLGIFTLLLLLIIINLLLNPYKFIKLNYLYTLLSLIFIIGIYLIINKIQAKIKHKKLITIILSVLYVLLQISVAYIFMVKPSWDFGQVFNIAKEFAISKHPVFGSSYLYVCDNNIMFSVVLDIFFKIGYLLGIKHFVGLGILLNIIMIDLSLFYTYKLLKLINKKYINAYILFCLLISPLVLYIPIFYTDTITLPFIIIPLYNLYRFFFVKQKISYIMVSGLLIGIGAMFKPTTLILLIAIMIFLIIRNQKINHYIFVPLILILVIIPLIGQKVFVNHFFDKDSLYLYRIPTLHYISIGLENNGEYSEKSYRAINSFVGEDIKKNYVKEKIKNRVKEMINKHEVLKFYNRKITYTWTDGTFYSFEKLRREPVHKEYTKYVFGDKDMLYWSMSNAEWIIILILMLASIIFRKYLNKEQKDLNLIINISIFGLFLFLLIWETRSRYLVNYMPLFLINAYIGLCAITNYIQDRRIKK